MAETAALDPIEETALLQAYWRAVETRSKMARLFDPLACAVTEALVDAARMQRFSSGLPVYAEIHVCSVIAADRGLAKWAAAIDGPRQVVVLGCGFDGRATRGVAGPAASFFLIDRRRVLDLLAPHLAAAATPVRLVEGNLARPDALFEALPAAGWQPRIPTAFVAEGVAEFLGGLGTKRLVAAAMQRAVRGSVLLLQMLDPSLPAHAAELGDARFPWRRLPGPAEVVGDDLARPVERLPFEGPTRRSGGSATPLSHVFAVSA